MKNLTIHMAQEIAKMLTTHRPHNPFTEGRKQW